MYPICRMPPALSIHFTEALGFTSPSSGRLPFVGKQIHCPQNPQAKGLPRPKASQKHLPNPMTPHLLLGARQILACEPAVHRPNSIPLVYLVGWARCLPPACPQILRNCDQPNFTTYVLTISACPKRANLRPKPAQRCGLAPHRFSWPTFFPRGVRSHNITKQPVDLVQAFCMGVHVPGLRLAPELKRVSHLEG